MTKPMYCPMSFVGYLGEDTSLLVECTPDCAWAVKENDYYFCSQAAIAIGYRRQINIRPLKDDAE